MIYLKLVLYLLITVYYFTINKFNLYCKVLFMPRAPRVGGIK